VDMGWSGWVGWVGDGWGVGWCGVVWCGVVWWGGNAFLLQIVPPFEGGVGWEFLFVINRAAV